MSLYHPLKYFFLFAPCHRTYPNRLPNTARPTAPTACPCRSLALPPKRDHEPHGKPRNNFPKGAIAPRKSYRICVMKMRSTPRAKAPCNGEFEQKSSWVKSVVEVTDPIEIFVSSKGSKKKERNSQRFFFVGFDSVLFFIMTFGDPTASASYPCREQLRCYSVTC